MAGMITILIVGLLSVVCADKHCKGSEIHVPESIIQRLYELVSDGQVRTETPTVSGQTKIKSKGSYKCVMKSHSFGNIFQTALRWAVNTNELNAFVPMWVSIVLLEAHRYGAAPRPSDEQLISAVDFCSEFIDTSKPYNGSLVCFWKNIFEESTQRYEVRSSSSVDLLNLIKATTVNNPVSQTSIDKTNLHAVVKTANEVVRIITGSDNIGDTFMSVMLELDGNQLAPDADDTTVWLGLGSLLKTFDEQFLPVFSKWIQYNPNISSVFNALKEFAYRPFSSDPVASTIDAQSYYVVRHFLDDAKAAGKDVALASTWFTNYRDAMTKGGGVIAHKVVNELDITVCSNVINGITASILSGLVKPDVLHDPELHKIYQNTSEMISYLINSNLSNRVDLALSYYPSRYQFYWTVARTVSIMDSYKRKRPLPLDVMELVFSSLRQAMDGEATRFLVSAVKRNDDGSLYFDDFLGNGDVTEDNIPIVRGEDRIFTTSIAINVLLYTWLSFDSDSALSQWRSDTPEIVKETVDGCILWLVKNALGGQFKPWNVFFSAQNKGNQNLPFRYPHNLFFEVPKLYHLQYVTSVQTIVGMQGYVPKIDYEAMIKQTHFGYPVPTDFNGFNDPDFEGRILLWSSDPYTYAVTLLALSRYKNIGAENENGCSNRYNKDTMK